MMKKIMAMMMVILVVLTGCNTSQVDNTQDIPKTKESINFYYPNIDDGKYYFIRVNLEKESEKDIKEILAQQYKDNIIKDTGSVISENTKINEINLDDEGILHIDFNEALRNEMNAGSEYEAMIIQSITNTFGQYYDSDKVVLTIDGKLYESGHVLLEEGEYFETDFSNISEVDKSIS